jgi:3-deoxy-D-arabino-heptulosonate 7-phosphate (DAHP) synthase
VVVRTNRVPRRMTSRAWEQRRCTCCARVREELELPVVTAGMSTEDEDADTICEHIDMCQAGPSLSSFLENLCFLSRTLHC